MVEKGGLVEEATMIELMVVWPIKPYLPSLEFCKCLACDFVWHPHGTKYKHKQVEINSSGSNPRRGI